MISPGKSARMLSALKDYRKRYLSKGIGELDESGTRIMINTFLTSILGFKELEEIKTEYMIKGTYADYIVQIGGKRYFLVEVKALSIDLSDKHLRQAINCGANEGIDWAILTNGRQLQLYKILFEKPIREKLVFEIDFSSEDFNPRSAQEQLSYLHREAVVKKSLTALWSRCSAIDPTNIAGHLFSPQVIKLIRKALKVKHGAKFSEEEVKEAIAEVVNKAIPLDNIKMVRVRKKDTKEKSTDLGPLNVPGEVSNDTNS